MRLLKLLILNEYAERYAVAHHSTLGLKRAGPVCHRVSSAIWRASPTFYLYYVHTCANVSVIYRHTGTHVQRFFVGLCAIYGGTQGSTFFWRRNRIL